MNFEPPECRARGCRSAESQCGKPVEHELEADGLVTFLCRTHRVVLRMLAKDYDWDYSMVPCRHHASSENGNPRPEQCRYRRVNVWGWERMA